MGFYPVCPGSNEYQLASPSFEKITLNLDKSFYPGKKFEVEATPGNQAGVFSKMELNGKKTETLIKHENLQKGGKLNFLK
jgi:putative alpha-1,2-mannosidase